MADILDCRRGRTADDDVALLLTHEQASVVCTMMGAGGGNPAIKCNAHTQTIYDVLERSGFDNSAARPKWNGICLTYK